jgi:hypothetical protein
MKRIELKRFQFTMPEGGQQTMDYKGQLQHIMRMATDPQRGADIDEIRHSLRVIDALDKADGFVELEDADYEFMVKKVRAARFPVAVPELLQFLDDVTAHSTPRGKFGGE